MVYRCGLTAAQHAACAFRVQTRKTLKPPPTVGTTIGPLSANRDLLELAYLTICLHLVPQEDHIMQDTTKHNTTKQYNRVQNGRT